MKIVLPTIPRALRLVLSYCFACCECLTTRGMRCARCPPFFLLPGARRARGERCVRQREFSHDARGVRRVSTCVSVGLHAQTRVYESCACCLLCFRRTARRLVHAGSVRVDRARCGRTDLCSHGSAVLLRVAPVVTRDPERKKCVVDSISLASFANNRR